MKCEECNRTATVRVNGHDLCGRHVDLAVDEGDDNPKVERVTADDVPCRCGGMITYDSGECDSCDDPQVYGA